MRHFTVDEANALLPMLTPVLESMRDLHARLMEAAVAVRDFEGRASQNGHGEGSQALLPQYDLRQIHADIQERVRFLHELGCVVKDIEHGIVDFPTRMNGQDVYLCWRLGEEQVSHWHDVDSGFAGRRPL